MVNYKERNKKLNKSLKITFILQIVAIIIFFLCINQNLDIILL